MIVRFARNPLFALAVCALSGSIALAQQAPSAPATGSQAPAPAPVERRPPMRPGMHGNFRANMARNRGNMHGGFRGGMAGGFRGAQGGPMGAGFHIAPEGMWWKNPIVVQRLSLTPEQTKRMDDIFQESRLQLIDLRADVQKQEVMLEPLLSANPLDSAKAMAQIDKVADARANLEKADAKMLLGIRGVLTPDQWTKLSTRQGPGAAGGPGGPGQNGPGSGRMRGPRGGGPSPAASNLIDPIDQP